MRAFGLVGVLWLGACASANTDVVTVDDLDDPRERPSADAAPDARPTPPRGSSSSSGSPSSSGSVAPISDAGADAEPEEEETCDPNWALTAPESIGDFGTNVRFLTLTGDEKTAYYSASNGRVYGARRNSISAPFGNFVELAPNINSGDINFVRVSDDGLELTFTKLMSPNAVHRSTRPSTEAGFGTSVVVRSSASADFAARDGSVRFFDRPVPQFPTVRIWTAAVRPAEGADNAAVNIFQGSPLWYEPGENANTLWLRNPSGAVMLSRWDGQAWSTPSTTEYAVHFTSPDHCRVYGVHQNSAYVRHRAQF